MKKSDELLSIKSSWRNVALASREGASWRAAVNRRETGAMGEVEEIDSAWVFASSQGRIRSWRTGPRGSLGTLQTFRERWLRGCPQKSQI